MNTNTKIIMNGLATLLASYDLQIAEESSQKTKNPIENDQPEILTTQAKKQNSTKKNIEAESYRINLEETKKSY